MGITAKSWPAQLNPGADRKQNWHAVYFIETMQILKKSSFLIKDWQMLNLFLVHSKKVQQLKDKLAKLKL